MNILLSKSQFEEAELGLNSSLQRVLEAARARLSMDFGFISEFSGGSRTFRHTDGEFLGLTVGFSSPLAETLCSLVAAGKLPGVIADVKNDASARSVISCDIGAHISAPIKRVDGSITGTLCLLSRQPRPGLDHADLAVVGTAADIVASLLDQAAGRRNDYLVIENEIHDVLASRSINVLYQPIFRVADCKVASYEALSRFHHYPGRTPDVWFASASALGLGIDLEMLAIEEAMAGLLSLPLSSSIAINASPSTICSQRFRDYIQLLPLNRLVVEVTEHDAIANYAVLREALLPFRSEGLRLAIDDVGAGFSSFRHVLNLSPDLIKLDLSLIRGIDTDVGRQALVEGLAHFGRRMNCEIVAEGVETQDELAVLLNNGVTKIQGYLISKPLAASSARLFDVAQGLKQFCSRAA